MSHGNTYHQRRYNRYVKGMRRVREDRAQHGSDHSCSCFEANGRGAAFARFADHPALCSSPTCCGNPRSVDGPTIQEKKAPTAKDWE